MFQRLHKNKTLNGYFRIKVVLRNETFDVTDGELPVKICRLRYLIMGIQIGIFVKGIN